MNGKFSQVQQDILVKKYRKVLDQEIESMRHTLLHGSLGDYLEYRVLQARFLAFSRMLDTFDEIVENLSKDDED